MDGIIRIDWKRGDIKSDVTNKILGKYKRIDIIFILLRWIEVRGYTHKNAVLCCCEQNPPSPLLILRFLRMGFHNSELMEVVIEFEKMRSHNLPEDVEKGNRRYILESFGRVN